MSKISKKMRSWRRVLCKQSAKTYMSLGVLVVGLVAYTGFMMSSSSINPATYRPLLQLIAEAESNGNYNAYYGSPDNQSVQFISMSVQEVMDWQSEFINQGSPSSAVGRYQIIDSTLRGLVEELELDTSEVFNPQLQDKMAITLLERRGAANYVKEELSAEEFAANLAMEWAALPRVVGGDPEQSYYAGDGLNQSRVTSGQILAVINAMGR